MHFKSCIICCAIPIVCFPLTKINKLKKSLISYYKTNGITYLRKHIDANHSNKLKTFQEEVNFAMGESLKRHHAKNTKYS